MAIAKKCDRCGVYYDQNTQHPRTVRKIKTVVVGVCLVARCDDSIEDRDLCDDCITKLELFLDGRELADI